MRFISKILVRLGVAFLFVALVYGLISREYGGVAFLSGTGIASLFVAALIRISPALEFIRATPEVGIDRDGLPVMPEPEVAGADLPGPSAAPVFLALGAAVLAVGLALDMGLWVFLAVGGGILLGALVGWARQAWNERERRETEAGDTAEESAPR